MTSYQLPAEDDDDYMVSLQVADALTEAVTNGRSVDKTHGASMLAAAIFTGLDGDRSLIKEVSRQLSSQGRRPSVGEVPSDQVRESLGESGPFDRRAGATRVGLALDRALAGNVELIERIGVELAEFVKLAGAGHEWSDMCYEGCPPQRPRPFRGHMGHVMCDHYPTPHFKS